MPVLQWGAETQVSANSDGPKVVALPFGGFAVVWTQGSGAAREVYFQLYDAFGQPTSEPTLLDADASSQYAPFVTQTPTGFAVGVTSDFNDGGDDDARLYTFDYFDGLTQTGVSATFDDEFVGGVASGRLGGAERLYTAYTDPAGVHLYTVGGSVVSISAIANASDADVTVLESNAVVTWQEGPFHLSGRFVTPTGATVGETFQILTGGQSILEHDVTALRDGRFAVAYVVFDSGPLIPRALVRVFQGSLVDYTLDLNIGPDRTVSSVDVIGTPDGGFYVIYSAQDRMSAPSAQDLGIYGQRFSAAGQRLGGEFFVAPETLGQSPDIVVLNDGRLVVSYADEAGNGFFQILDPRDGVVNGSGEFEALVGNEILADQINGLAGDDELYGLGGSDLLNGGSGEDLMVGGAGDDVYHVDTAGDRVVEFAGEGIDTVYSKVSFDNSTLPGQAIENITLTGTANINATGYNGRNVLTGNSGNNELNGKGGDDLMIGGLGDDTYIVDRAGDLTVEKAGQGFDTVKTAFTHTLQANVEKLVIVGSSAVNGTGNDLDNNITGNDAANVITGGLGRDVMDGRGGNDTFDFNAVAETAVATPDRITDLAAGDKVDFATIDANSIANGNQAFTRVAAFTGVAGQMTITFNSGAGITDVRGDVNGDGTADFRLFITGDQTAFTGWVF